MNILHTFPESFSMKRVDRFGDFEDLESNVRQKSIYGSYRPQFQQQLSEWTINGAKLLSSRGANSGGAQTRSILFSAIANKPIATFETPNNGRWKFASQKSVGGSNAPRKNFR